MPARVRAIRGATTLEEDSPEQVRARVQQLVSTILVRNSLRSEDVISILFTATEDIVSMFPATAARELGLDEVPLICARELSVKDSLPLCIRLMMHVSTDSERVNHVFLEAAKELRSDLA